MLYNTNKGLIKRSVISIFLVGSVLFTASCALITKPLDNRTGFSKYLMQVETSIRSEDWSNAETNLEDAKKAWKKIKPLMQVDIDHDYIKDIEDGFEQLDAYLYTKDKSNALASILLVESTWRNIGSL
ncbi:hypothetical protein AXX12_14300 [Anaerosporomusa subterranea]|uniref:DUF4363 domain-containing protein n=1 Tax=Anaerosporomusa subterranea TaxID=1794912 RepID=A0A154BN14_ANASB|nr:DUF4363 family protein [Anaerosporomusa subterranea]KYZ75322.1 hypothetical protein AXX12_14300 [Anaerosporomusa subterranea]